ncbi:bifunctional DNA primase/polymerase [Luedemannella helvata]|uniref:Bifunctional DNA primase/polymerase n=1 Tax=Luedemannella helvata TaxID=349315 RepID=A0ABP4XE92_9ACTN
MNHQVDRETLLHNALSLAERGWFVFPLRPGDKRPAFPDHSADRCTGSDPRCRRFGTHIRWENRATIDPDRIRRAWTTAPYNIGIACGVSGLVVVDLDQPKPDQVPPTEWRREGIADGGDVFAAVCEQAGQPMPIDTYTVTTGRGGTHLYYAAPDDDGHTLSPRNTSGTLGWLIDTRAMGGYVVAAGSTVPAGRYEVTHDTAPAPLPGWLAERLRPAPLPPQEPVTVDIGTGRRAAYLNAAVTRSVAAIETAPDGTLNRTLYGASVALGQLVAGDALCAAEVEAVLLDAAIVGGHPQAGALRTIRSGMRAGANRPRSVAA